MWSILCEPGAAWNKRKRSPGLVFLNSTFLNSQFQPGNPLGRAQVDCGTQVDFLIAAPFRA